ncbi:MAG: neutral/alkaline non-lysosomal ceramidase N-terminal domain-containing protein [Candidatus Omnitrophica bacterium]|nr:neutral/alkaline non-lysosomal ceramidase N-terminal domain-containing protein [Candidatus Omnitrophota bacterium]
MKVGAKTRFVLWMIGIGLLAAYPVFAEAEHQAGVAKVCITPEGSIWMSGYAARDKPSDGKLHDLYAKALALKDEEGNCIVLLTTDLIGLSKEISGRVAGRVKEKTGLDRSALMLTSSHTHSGPVLRSNLETMYDLPEEQWDRITAYTQKLEDQLVEVICDAVENLGPAEIYRGCGSAGFAVNRRQYTLGGVVIGVNPIGPVDHDVPVLKVENGQGEIIAIVFGYACHNTTLSVYQINGDYAGFAQAYLEESRPNAAAMFFIGCGADANPNPRREIEHAKAHGRELSAAVEKVLREPMEKVKGSIQCEFRTVDLPLTPAPTREQLEEQAQDQNVYIQRRAQSLLDQFEKQGSLPESYPYVIQAWQIGDDFLWLGLAGEVVVDYALLFKHLYGRGNTWVTGYANDVFAYVPSLRVLREGGYESDTSMIYYGLYGPWRTDVEKVIVSTVQSMIEDMQS